jgi:peptide/nickel transport system ATP-binding protein
MPSLAAVPPGCPFHPRCDHADALCSSAMPGSTRFGERRVRCHHPLSDAARVRVRETLPA